MQAASSDEGDDTEEVGIGVKAPSAYRRDSKLSAAKKGEADKKAKAGSAGNRLAQLKEKRRGRKMLQPVRKKVKKDGKGGKAKGKGKGKSKR